MNVFCKGWFFASSMTNLRNGSCYRVTGRKKEFAAVYIFGDFHGFITEAEFSLESLSVAVSREESLRFLPLCFS